MTKEERDRLWRKHSYGSAYQFSVEKRMLAEIAYQLTRIADQGDVVSAYLNVKANISLDKEMDKLRSKPTPDSTGLVEAVKLAVSNDRAAKKSWCVNHKCERGIDNMVETELGIHIVANALATHEKPEVDA